MAKTPFAEKPLGQQQGEDVVHGQDEQVEEEEEGCGEEDEIILDDGSGGEVDASSFEGMVAMLEDIMMDEGFNDLVGGFMKQHCGEFDEGEENKLVYTTLFAEYTAMLERYIAEHISTRLPDFDMPAFCAQLRERSEELPISHLDLDTLGAFGDFEAFKEMMVSCKAGQGCGEMCVMGELLPVHADEQEDGVEMPDLNLSITAVASPSKG
jgi:ADP-ribosylation factor 2-binding protein|tara:strand:- start:192 stop:821 length:630 start_codon:yes stop_codon:yes gene_type:complete